MIAEQSADADHPYKRRLPQRADGVGPRDPACGGSECADRKRHRRQLERGNAAGRHRQHRQQRPHQDRGEADERGGAGGHHCFVMAGLVPAIHVFAPRRSKTWMPGTSPGMTSLLCSRRRRSHHTIYCPPLIDSVEPVMAPASSAARNTTARAISSGSPRRLTGISGRMLFSSTSFGTACTISVLI